MRKVWCDKNQRERNIGRNILTEKQITRQINRETKIVTRQTDRQVEKVTRQLDKSGQQPLRKTKLKIARYGNLLLVILRQTKLPPSQVEVNLVTKISLTATRQKLQKMFAF